MRYERMFLAAIASAICFFLGLQFGSMTMQVVAAAPGSFALSLQSPSLQLALFALTSGGFTSLGIAFLLFAIIKIAPLFKPHHFDLFVRARAVGILFLWGAFACAGLWLAANVALQILKS